MSALAPWLDYLAGSLVLLGAIFALLGALGLARFSSFLRRLHGPTKASTLGVGCVLIASMLVFSPGPEASLHELLITLFIFLTAPVSAHLLVKAALQQQPELRPAAPPAERDSPN